VARDDLPASLTAHQQQRESCARIVVQVTEILETLVVKTLRLVHDYYALSLSEQRYEKVVEAKPLELRPLSCERAIDSRGDTPHRRAGGKVSPDRFGGVMTEG
jgi:hypothetical protein